MRYWSDYNRVYYHPRSIVQAYESDLSPEQKSFHLWSHGEDLFHTMDKENDIFDEQLRLLVEECDQSQGFQMLTSVDNGWGGFASNYVDRIADEMGRKSLWVWTLKGPTPQTRVRKPPD